MKPDDDEAVVKFFMVRNNQLDFWCSTIKYLKTLLICTFAKPKKPVQCQKVNYKQKTSYTLSYTNALPSLWDVDGSSSYFPESTTLLKTWQHEHSEESSRFVSELGDNSLISLPTWSLPWCSVNFIVKIKTSRVLFCSPPFNGHSFRPNRIAIRLAGISTVVKTRLSVESDGFAIIAVDLFPDIIFSVEFFLLLSWRIALSYDDKICGRI